MFLLANRALDRGDCLELVLGILELVTQTAVFGLYRVEAPVNRGFLGLGRAQLACFGGQDDALFNTLAATPRTTVASAAPPR